MMVKETNNPTLSFIFPIINTYNGPTVFKISDASIANDAKSANPETAADI